MWAGLRESVMMRRHPDTGTEGRPRGKEREVLSEPQRAKTGEEGLPSRGHGGTQPLSKS